MFIIETAYTNIDKMQKTHSGMKAFAIFVRSSSFYELLFLCNILNIEKQIFTHFRDFVSKFKSPVFRKFHTLQDNDIYFSV